MRVCSICGERNEDWMEICQRCGNSIVNANQVELKTAKKAPKKFLNDMDVKQSNKLMANMDLKITLVVLVLILIVLLACVIFS